MVHDGILIETFRKFYEGFYWSSIVFFSGDYINDNGVNGSLELYWYCIGIFIENVLGSVGGWEPITTHLIQL